MLQNQGTKSFRVKIAAAVMFRSDMWRKRLKMAIFTHLDLRAQGLEEIL